MNRPSTNTLFLWTKGQKLDLHQKVEAMTEYHNLLEYITELEDTLKSKFAVIKRQLIRLNSCCRLKYGRKTFKR